MKLNTYNFLPFSLANGPGCRAVLWVQGCPLHCPGCCNPETHAFGNGQWIEVDEILGRIISEGQRIEGVTISGGEPLWQLPALTELLRRIKYHTQLSVILFTGFGWAEVLKLLATPQHGIAKDESLAQATLDHQTSLLSYVDVLVAGRYDQQHRVAHGLRGSSNKTVHLLTNRYSLQDIESVPAAEIVIQPDGRVIQSGIVPLGLQETLQTG